MRITEVRGFVVGPSGGSGAADDGATVLVRIATDSGLVGWGEAYGARGIAESTRVALESMIAPRCVGAEPSPAELPDRIRRALYGASANGPFAYALGGVDIALWDLQGQAAGRPVHALLGSQSATRVAAAARVDGATDADGTLTRVRNALASEPAAIHLYDVRPEVIEAVARLCAQRQVPLAVDAACAWPVHEATSVLRKLQPLQLAWVAEPIWPPESHAAHALLRSRSGVRVASGFNAASHADFERMLAGRAIDVARLDITRVGGVSSCAQLAVTAKAGGIGLSALVHGAGPGLLATLHACAALAPAATIEHPLLAAMPFTDSPQARAGAFEVPAAPGLGFEPDPEWLATQGLAA